MNVLILGGTGAMGIHLTQIMKDRGVDTFVTSRKEKSSKENLNYLQGDAKNLVFLQKILRLYSWDTIVDFMVYSTQQFKERVDLLLSSTRQYVYLSSSRVYADSEQPIREDSARLLDTSQDTDYLSTDEYALTKARQEDILKNSKFSNWTIIRPYITYSENRLQLGTLEKEEWLYRVLHGRSIVFSRDILEKTTTLTYGFDVANGIAHVIGNSVMLGQTFHITNGEPITWSEVLEIYLSVLDRHLGVKSKVILQGLDEFIEWKMSKYQIFYDRLYNRTFDNTAISKLVDSSRFLNTRMGLEKCLTDFLLDPTFNVIDWRAEGIKDRQVSEFTNLEDIPTLKQKIKYLVYRYNLPWIKK